MIIHLSTSYRARNDEDLEYLNCIKETIHESGSVLARDWIELVSNKVNSDTLQDEDWVDVVNDNASATSRADICIIEATNYGFYDGFQLASALKTHTPVLVVGRNPLKNWIISGIDNPLITLEQYHDKAELKKIVSGFLREISDMTLLIQSNPGVRVAYAIKKMGELSHKTDGELLRDLAEDGLKYRRFLNEG